MLNHFSIVEILTNDIYYKYEMGLTRYYQSLLTIAIYQTKDQLVGE